MTLPAGTTLAAYAIERLLGRGGMGEVYLATHEGLGRKVALKLLAPELAADPAFRERFIAESRLAASLDHPHIVPIYEAGEADERLFLAMRYVEGDDLGALIAAAGPLDPGRAVGLLAGIAAALDAAHDRGLVHRDVKPANILVARTARAEEHAYLGDFGLTKEQGSDAGFTRTGQLVGSIDYVAPEQIEGRPIDGRVDVYSLACVLYTALTGHPPYRRQTEVATLWAHVQAEPPRPSEQDPALAPYDPVIATGMAKDPTARYQTAGELLAAAREAAATETVAGKAATETVASDGRPGSWADLDPLIGRDDELASLLDELGRSRLVSLTGPGGSGKTRLAEAVVSTVRVRGRDAWFVDLSAVEDASLVAATITTTMRLQGSAAREPIDVVIEALAQREAVLGLDNLEQIAGVGRVVTSLLRGAPRLRILTTSRVPLGVRGEIEVAVPTLGLPAEATVEAVERSPAGALFLGRARALGRLRTIDERTAADISTLLRRLDGLPLAIELAAARTRAMSPAEIVGRLDQQGTEAIDTHDGDRHRSLRAILDWTVGLLSPAELETLEAVSACAGFDFDLAQALAPDIDVVDAIESLVALGLIASLGTVGTVSRFRLLETIRTTVLRSLTDDRLHELEDRHARKFLDLAEEWDRQTAGGWTPDLVERLDADADNIRRALDRLDVADPRQSLALGSHLASFWQTRGRLAEGFARFKRTSALAPEPSVELARASARQLALTAQGVVGPIELRALTDQTVEMARAVADPSALISALSSRMWIAQYEGDSAAAVAAEAEIEGLDLSGLDARTQISLMEMRTLAAGARYGLSSDEYVERLRQQVAEAAHAGWAGEQAIAAGNLAQILSVRGEHVEAASMNGLAARLFRELERSADLGWALSYRAVDLAEIGRASEAVEAAIEGADIAATLQLPMTIADSLRTSMPVALVTAQPLLAARLWGAVRAMHERGDYVLPAIEQQVAEGWLARASLAAPSVAIEEALREGAGEDPLELLRALPELLRSPIRAPAEPAPADIPRGVREVPAPISELIGRERELGELADLLATHRLVTITGPGGSGKTRLALELGWTPPDPAADISFVDLAPIRDPAMVPAAIASRLGIADDGQLGPMARLEAHLADRNSLVILDNFEQVLDAGPQIATLLAKAPRLRVVATSRAPLRLRGERDYPLGPLALAGAGASLSTITQSAAVRLFVERARDAGATLSIDSSNGPLLAEICRRLDSLPLAIELAAARIRDLDLDAIARGLDRRLEMLTDGPRDAADRQRTIRLAIDWSHELIGPAEATLFRRLSVFAGGWTAEAAADVCGGELDGAVATLLGKLSAQSLVVRHGSADGAEERYGMLETIREYAAEELVSSDDAGPTRQRHAAYFTSLAERAERESRGQDAALWRQRIRSEFDNIRSAMHWAIEEDAPEPGLRIAASLRSYVLEIGFLSEWRELLARLLELPGPKADLVHANALNAAGNLAWLQADFDSARAYHNASLAIRLEIGDPEPIAASLSNLGLVSWQLGDYRGAQTFLEDSLAKSREIGDVWGAAATLGNLADVAIFELDFERAATLYAEALAEFRALGDVGSIGRVLSNLGQLAIYRGEHEAAATILAEAETLTEQIQDDDLINSVRLNLGQLATRRGDFARARTLLAESFEHSRATGGVVGVVESLERLGELLAREGDHRAAARTWGSAAAVRHEAGAEMYPVDRAWYDDAVASVRTTLGESAFATEWSVGERTDQAAVAAAHLPTEDRAESQPIA